MPINISVPGGRVSNISRSLWVDPNIWHDGSPFGEDYVNRVLSIARDNLIGYWPMGELSGTVSTDYSPQKNDGAYTGVSLGYRGIGDGRTCPLFDGANDLNNIYSAALNTDFNGLEGTIAVWAKVSAAGVWADATLRVIMRLRVDASNEVQIRKTATANQLSWLYVAGGTTDSVASTALGAATDWLHLALTWSDSEDSLKAYANGVQVGLTQTTLGDWTGVLSSTTCHIGAASTTPTNVWDGYLAHAALWTTPLTAAQVAALAVV